MNPRVAVLGGGISGLVAAYRLRRLLSASVDIDIFERSDHVGGTLHSVEVGGIRLDVGAEAFLVRRPEATALVHELGLTHLLVHPGTLGPNILSGASLHPVARPTLMGIPGDPDTVAHLAEADDLRLMAREPARALKWRSGQDISIGELVGDRFGRSVVERSVDPMLSGVYSARSDDLGLRAVMPGLAARLDAGAPDLTSAVTSLLGAATGSGPVFGALLGGYPVLVDELLRQSAPIVHVGTSVGEVRRTPRGWAVDGEPFDGVVCALPAPVTAEIFASVEEIAQPLAGIDVSGSAVVAMALDSGVELPQLSGVLVAGDETSVRAKAFTFSSRKWNHLAGDGGVVRASFGRYGASVSGIDDRQLIDWASTDLGVVMALAGQEQTPVPVRAAVVQRWPGGIPRYAPGHTGLVSQIDRDRPARLVLAGATYSGVGVPACIGRADAVARVLVTDLAGG
ncbi:protoporphyrinogen oxidase [Williamsia sp. 1138]|uniref:FAD-dependent oxidoreductase n=1 Tax=Williamsia sp. 1138 TaxID=1903117 RepID=UPI000A100FB5|nr:FAD-dependent oxidoreductase [Williamsia sp. 1138]OZG26653.1 protoporphyrinogen oxidase [Williamsia sp. 1138]